MSYFKVELSGLGTLQELLHSLATDKMEQIEGAVEAAAYDIAANAKTRVPKDMGGGLGLSGSITVVQNGKNYEIVVQKEHAPYVEFGTGQNAANYLNSKDPELRNYAMNFYKNGLGRMMPQPFLFPAMIEEKAKLIELIKNILLS